MCGAKCVVPGLVGFPMWCPNVWCQMCGAKIHWQDTLAKPSNYFQFCDLVADHFIPGGRGLWFFGKKVCSANNGK